MSFYIIIAILIFSFIPVIGIIWWQSRKLNLGGGNTRATASGKPYYWSVHTNKGRVTQSWLRIDATFPSEFILEEEHGFQRFSKAFGFCDEFQTMDEQFNTRVFILCDSSAMRSKLAMDSKLKHAITAVMNAGAKRIMSSKDKLSIQMKYASHDIDHDTAEICVNALQQIRDSLSSTVETDESWISSRNKRYFFNVMNVVFFMAGIGLSIIDAENSYTRFNVGTFLPVLAQYALPAVIAWFILLRIVVGNTSYGYKAFSYFLFFGMWAMTLMVGSGILYANGRYDTSPDVIENVQVIDKRSYQSNKNTHYEIIYLDEYNNRGQLNVAYSMYQQAQPRDTLRFYNRSGYLAIPWTQHIELIKYK